MKNSFSIRALCLALLLSVLGTSNSNAAFKNWTNSLGGNWFDPFGWSPNGVPTANDIVTITNNGTYTVLVSTGTVATAFITVGGGTGKQSFVWGSTAGFANLTLTNSTVLANGVLAVTNQAVSGFLTIKSGGELQLNSVNGLQLYNFAITNEGTISWLNGSLVFGSTVITNSGLFQATSDFGASYGGGGGKSVIYNTGTIRKSSGVGLSYFSSVDIVNSGVVDVLSGTFQLGALGTNFLSGSYTATTPGLMKFAGLVSDAGGTVSGSGQFQFASGTFYLRTNTIPNIKFVGGDVYVSGTTTFQQAGAITNLTLDGSNLRGTNRVGAGTLTVNSGNLLDTLIVQPAGQLALVAQGGGTQLYGLNLFNQGAVNYSGTFLQVGNTLISNGGAWTITSDSSMSYGGVGSNTFFNAGTFQKTGGSGTFTLTAPNFINTPVGIIRAASGTLQMAFNYTNAAGEIQLNGGTLSGSGVLGMTGGILDGVGNIGVNAVFDGGNVAPGPIAGAIRFASGLSLGTNVMLTLDGTGTVPGVQYDQLSVTGAVAISNCTLQVTSLPSVPVGTSFVIITNTTANATTGYFNGLPENSPLTISGQPFRIHYSGGTGNDVILVRDSAAGVGPLLSNTGYSNTVYRLAGAGSSSTIYTIQASTNLVQWTNIGFSTGDLSGQFKFTDTNAYLFRYRMYRATN